MVLASQWMFICIYYIKITAEKSLIKTHLYSNVCITQNIAGAYMRFCGQQRGEALLLVKNLMYVPAILLELEPGNHFDVYGTLSTSICTCK